MIPTTKLGSPKRVLVCGGRDYDDLDFVWRTLNDLAEADDHGLATRPIVIIHGGARGADEFADRWATSQFLCPEVYPADWSIHGRSAGPRRNQRMIDEGKPG